MRGAVYLKVRRRPSISVFFVTSDIPLSSRIRVCQNAFLFIDAKLQAKAVILRNDQSLSVRPFINDLSQ